ncbi:MAG: trypsin-like peptidase domain-containing protein, partial [Alphaproteobacteria bacterium]
MLARNETIRGAASAGLRAGGALLLASTLGFAFMVQVSAREAPETFADMAERLLPSVVNISTSQVVRRQREDVPQAPPGSPFEEFFREFFDQNPKNAPRRATSLGSGFIIESSGLVVTNNHVIADADEITVVLADNTRHEAKVLGRDPKTDLALLEIDAGRELPALQWGDSETARVGEWVVAIGNPFGLGGSVTAGIISAVQRDINAGPYDSFIQTDASINRGNSGGPLFNMDGLIIGVNTAIFSPTGGSVGIGFSIPSTIAQRVIAQLREYGRTKRGWLGVRIQTVTDEIAESLG